VTLVFDANVIFASLDRDDEHHLACRQLVERSPERRVVPAPILVELDHFIRQRLGFVTHAVFLRDVTDGAYFIADLLPDDYLRIRELCAKYRDSGIGLVDASVVAIAERLKEPKIATLDRRHFGIIRPRHIAAFELLPAGASH